MAKSKRKKKDEPILKIPPISKIKVIKGKEKERELLRREKKLKLKRFGKPGPRIKKKDVPESPKIIQKPIGKKIEGRKVYGIEAIVYGRGESSEPGKAIYVTKKGFFENIKGNANPITYKSAKSRLKGFVDRLQRKYVGRLSPISMEIRYITKNESSDRIEHFKRRRKQSKDK